MHCKTHFAKMVISASKPMLHERVSRCCGVGAIPVLQEKGIYLPRMNRLSNSRTLIWRHVGRPWLH